MRIRILLISYLLTSFIGKIDGINCNIPFPKPVGQGKDTVSLFIIGDVMMHARQMEYDMAPFLSGIRPELERADFSIANMEFSLGGEPYSGYPAFSAPDNYAEYAAGCGIDVFLTANNHILDRGPKGLERTMVTYRSMRDSVLFTGTSSDEGEKESSYPLILKRKGISIALINFTYGTNAAYGGGWPKVNMMDTTDVSEAINRASEAGADFILALPHWGNEYELRHSYSQARWADWLVRKGVDAIIGGHPHVVQDTTHTRGTPVIFSVGNAVSNMSAENTRLELAVKLIFTRDRATGSSEMLEPELRFMWCTLPGTLTDSYCTIFVDEWKGRRDRWKNPYDYDNMMTTYRRVLSETGIKDEKDN